MRESVIKYVRILIGMITMVLLIGCSKTHQDERLLEVAHAIPDSLKRAERLLKGIDKRSLNNSDRHFYDFLKLKIDDKNYIRHSSDSMYLALKEYYSGHKNDALYPEVLYYGGRVYSDMGDYPTALKYFQEALDALPEDTPDLDLKSRILSQTGRLLNQLRLYSEAERYIEKVVEINRDMNDYESLMFNLQLLGSISMNLQNLTLARKYYQEAYEISKTISPTQEARAKMYLAEVEKELGNISYALSLIRGVPEAVRPIVQDQANAYACDIYYTAGILDSAFYYCMKLIDKSSASNRKTALAILLSPEMFRFIPTDSLSWYVQQYRESVMEYVNKNNTSQAELQVSAFNYTAKQQAMERMKEKQNKMAVFSLSTIIVILLLSGLLLFMTVREKIRKLQYQIARENIRNLQDSLEVQRSYYKHIRKLSQKEESISSDSQVVDGQLESMSEDNDIKQKEDKRTYYRKELLDAVSLGKTTDPSTQILESKVYSDIKRYIKDGKVIPSNSIIWKELETLVLEESPNFNNSLNLLMNGKVTENDFRTCLLIKIGLGPAEMCKVFGKSSGAVVSRRETISRKIYDASIGTKMIDEIIRLL